MLAFEMRLYTISGVVAQWYFAAPGTRSFKAGAHTRSHSAQLELFCPPYKPTSVMNVSRSCSS